MHRLTVALVVLGLLGGGCADDGGPAEAAVTTTTVSGDACDFMILGSQIHSPSLMTESGGVVRNFGLDLPNHDTGDRGLPLILNFHGNGSSAAQQESYSELGEFADDAIVVTPDGTGEPRHFSLVPGPTNPDIAFARDLVELLASTNCVDLDRVYASGISNGAGLSAELACAAPDVFAAVALIAATIPPLGCDPATRIPVLAFHGTADPIAPFDGGRLRGTGIPLPSAQEAIELWAEQDGCDPASSEEQVGDDMTHGTFSGCDADVAYYWIEGGGHVWPGARPAPVLGESTQTISASELISEWFADHPRED